MLRVGGVQLRVAEPVVVVDDTTIANAGREAVRLPSLTLMLMFEYVPVCALLGVPDSLPVVVLNVAQAGLFVMLNVSVLPSGSFAVGVNAYATPVLTDVGGVPEIVGGLFVVPPEVLTVIEKRREGCGPASAVAHADDDVRIGADVGGGRRGRQLAHRPVEDQPARAGSGSST